MGVVIKWSFKHFEVDISHETNVTWCYDWCSWSDKEQKKHFSLLKNNHVQLYIRESLRRDEPSQVQLSSKKHKYLCIYKRDLLFVFFINNLVSQMNMHERATKPSNWHLWQCRLGWASEWLDTNHAILSHVGPVSKGLFWLLVVDRLSPSCLCSSDSLGTPPDRGVVYPYDTF